MMFISSTAGISSGGASSGGASSGGASVAAGAQAAKTSTRINVNPSNVFFNIMFFSFSKD
jgi:hypothetical protein